MRVGLMSFAHVHAAGYARLLGAMPEVELLAADPDHGLRPGESGGAGFAADLGVPYVDSYDDLLAWGPDAVVVTAENSRHRPLTERAAAAGAHVLCEKPIATTLPDARAMIEACSAAGVSLMMAYPLHFSIAFARLRAVVEAGTLGTVVAASGTNNGRIPAGSRAWFVDPELAGGGALVDHTVHVAELLDVLVGSRPPTSVYAVANGLLPDGTAAVETAGLLSLEYTGTPWGDRLIATLDCSWSRPPSSPTWGGLTLQLTGSRAGVAMDAFNQRLDGQSEATGNGLWVPFGTDPDARMLEEFLAAVREGRPAQPDGEVGYRTLQVVEAAQRSAATGTVVTL